MDIVDIVKTALAVIIAVIGWIVAHYFSSKRDRTLKRREIITKHLIEAYKVLADDIVQRAPSPETDRKLEIIVAELQLFGSLRQIELAKKLVDDVVKGGTFNIDVLINDLRNDLRNELELPPVVGNVRWLRFTPKKNG